MKKEDVDYNKRQTLATMMSTLIMAGGIAWDDCIPLLRKGASALTGEPEEKIFKFKTKDNKRGKRI